MAMMAGEDWGKARAECSKHYATQVVIYFEMFLQDASSHQVCEENVWQELSNLFISH
jgi:hypothetical protein